MINLYFIKTPKKCRALYITLIVSVKHILRNFKKTYNRKKEYLSPS